MLRQTKEYMRIAPRPKFYVRKPLGKVLERRGVNRKRRVRNKRKREKAWWKYCMWKEHKGKQLGLRQSSSRKGVLVGLGLESLVALVSLWQSKGKYRKQLSLSLTQHIQPISIGSASPFYSPEYLPTSTKFLSILKDKDI